MPHYPNFAFDISKRASDSRARLGHLKTPHGTVETPNFIFCGTKASIKALSPHQVKDAGAQIILANTYHLMIQPGADLIEKMGGLHKFTGWNGPMLTDSGGYQIFAMGHGSVSNEIKGKRGANTLKPQEKTLLDITEKGATFRSYTNGEKIFLSPEKSIDIQRKLGADLIVQFDECPPFHVKRDYTEKSMHLSHRWGDRSLEEFERGDDGKQGIYGVVHGGIYEDLRIESAQYTKDRPFFGTAVGGCLGDTKEKMYEVVDMAMPHIHPDRPVHLLGIGDFDDIFNGVRAGIDTFDCVSPTRMARHGWARMPGMDKGRVNLRNSRFKDDANPIDETCHCYTCENGFSRAYIHHLIKAGEIFAMQLVSIHNIATMSRLMAEIREAIANDTLDELEEFWLGPKEDRLSA